MNSGRIVERRDQVLIGRLSLVARTASTLATKCASTNGPFLRQRPISYPLTIMTAVNDHAVRALVAAGAITLGGLTPRVNRHAPFTGLAFTTTVRVIDRVHDGTANGRTDTTPTLGTGFTDLAQVVFFVADFANRCTALDVHATNFARAETNLSIDAFTSQQLYRGTGRTRDLRTLAWQHLDAANRRTHRDIADRQGVARLDRSFGTAHDRLANHHTLVGDDVATFTICVAKQGDVGSTVRIILKTLNLGRNTVLVALEINQAIRLLVTTTLVTNGHVTIVVTTGILRLGFNQASERLAFVQVRIYDLHDATATRGSRFDFNEGHQAFPPSTKLISWPGFRL